MSQPKARDWKDLSPAELDQKKEALEKELFELRQKKVTGQLDKPHLFKRARKHIARILTLQREKQHA